MVIRASMGTNATDKADEVQASVALLRAVEAGEDGLVLVELPLLDRHVNPNDVLPHDAPGTDVQVAERITSIMTAIATTRTHACGGLTVTHSPYFGVSHEAIAETYSETVCGKRTVTVILRNRIHIRCISSTYSITLHVLLRCDAPPIMDTKSRKISDICASRRTA